MTLTSTSKTVEPGGAFDPGIVRVGADIVELVTSGMYLSPITVFREYVQNAADGIDAARSAGLLEGQTPGRVDVAFDHARRSVTIADDGVGVCADQVPAILLAIGGSSKRGTGARGFRGVGRLSGLAYCKELVFRTKAAGDPIESVLTWDAIALRSGIASARTGTDMREVIARSVRLETTRSDDKSGHFFEVTLRGVVRHRQDLLLNEGAVAHYLGQVAPLPFATDFSFGPLIVDRLSTASAAAVPLQLIVGGQEIVRPYRDSHEQPGTDKRLHLREVEFFELADVDGGIGGIGWLAHHDYVRSVSTMLGIRGLRARVGDIQIGDPDLFDSSFREPRFNGWTVGELHILDGRLVPNARRDNFEVNHHSNNLLVQLAPVASGVSHRCRTSSISRTASIIVRHTIDDGTALIASRQSDRLAISRCRAAVRRGALKLRRVDDSGVRDELSAELERLDTALAELSPADSAGVIAAEEAIALVASMVTNRAQAHQLMDALRGIQA